MSKGKSRYLNTLDWYIIKQIIVTFVVAIGLIIVVMVAMDLSSKLDDFLERKAPIKAIIVDYYLNFIPYMVNMFGHLFFFISVVYVCSRMTQRSETIAILAGGVSFKRYLRPFIISSIVVGLFGLYLGNVLIPQANVQRIAFEKQYYRNKFNNTYLNIHIQTNDSTQVYVHHFDNHKNTGFLFTKEVFSGESVKKKISADMIVFDTVQRVWKMTNYFVRDVKGKQESLHRGADSIVDLEGLLPDDFNKILNQELLNFTQLNQAIEREEIKGTSFARTLKIERYKRLFNPIAYIILTIIGVSLSCKKTRGGTGLNLAFGIALAFSLILIMKIFDVLAINRNLPPILSNLIPLSLYTLIAIILLRKAPK